MCKFSGLIFESTWVWPVLTRGPVQKSAIDLSHDKSATHSPFLLISFAGIAAEPKRPKTKSPDAASPAGLLQPAAAVGPQPPPPCDTPFDSPDAPSPGEEAARKQASEAAAAVAGRRPDWCARSSGGSLGWAAGAPGIGGGSDAGGGSPRTPPDASPQVAISVFCTVNAVLSSKQQQTQQHGATQGNERQAVFVAWRRQYACGQPVMMPWSLNSTQLAGAGLQQRCGWRDWLPGAIAIAAPPRRACESTPVGFRRLPL